MKNLPILNIGQFELEKAINDFYSNDLRIHLKNNELIIHKPHSHNFFLCVCFSEGSGIHEIDFDSYSIQKGSVFFLKPGQTHSWTFNSIPKGYIFFHTQEFYKFYFLNKELAQFPFYYSYKNPPNLVLSNKELEVIALQFQEINNEYHRRLPYKRQKLASLINLIYINLSRIYTNNKIEGQKGGLSTSYLQTLNVLEKKIEEFYKTEKSVKFYADKLNITSKHLNRITRSTIDKTATELITERVLLEAKRLIVHSNNSLSITAESLGYYDYAHFSKIFKLKEGMSPMKFKKKYDDKS